MDPQACFIRWLKAIECNNNEEAREAAEDLLGWLRAGGFKPRDWLNNPDLEATFYDWCGEYL